MALDTFFHNKIEAMKLEIIQGQAKLRRLEAQRNDYNSRVRLLREELGLLQQPGSYVGEVVKVMGTKKVLVKVHPEGKYGQYCKSARRSSLLTGACSRRHCRQRGHQQTYSRQARNPPQRLVQARKATAVFSRPARLAHDGREGARQHI